MVKANYLRVEKILKSVLMPNEELIGMYQSKKSKSVYACVLTDEVFYKVLRVGDHKAITPYFSQPTFDILKPDNALKSEIRESLYQTTWYKFDYRDYFTLKAIQESAKVDSRFYLAGDYKKTKKKADFYLLKKHTAKKDAIRLSNQLSKVLRRLFSGGLISIYKESEFDKPVYVSQFTFALLDKLSPLFEAEWQSDLKNINWYQFDLPKRYLPKHDKDGSEIERVWLNYNISVFQTEMPRPIYPDVRYYQKPKQTFLKFKQYLQRFLKRLRSLFFKIIKTSEKNPAKEELADKQNASLKQEPTQKWTKKEKIAFEPKRNQVKMTGVVDNQSLSALMSLRDELPKE